MNINNGGGSGSGGSGSNASVGSSNGTTTAPTSATEVGYVDGSGNLQPFSGTNAASGPNVAVSSSVLPTGASTSALQTTGNTSLASIDSKTPALGQQLAAASQPVVLTAAQLTTLTPLSTVTVTQATGTNLHTVVDSSALPTGAATSANQSTEITALQAIQANQTNGTQVVLLPTGAATSSLQTTGNGSLATIATNTTGVSTAALQTSGNSSLTTIASNQTNGTQTTQISGTVPLPTGASTSALQTTGNTSLASVVTNTSDLFVTGAGPATAVINTNLILATTGTAATDALGYHSVSFEVVTGASTTAVAVNFEASNDNVNFIAIGMYDKTTPTAAPATTFTTAASTQRYFEGPLNFRYFRVRLVAAIVAGTVQCFTKLSPNTYQTTNNSLAAGTQTLGNITTVTTVSAVTGITNALPAGTNNIGLFGTGGSTGVANAPVNTIYSAGNVTTAAYTQLIASTTSATNFVDIFDSSGQSMILATGGAGSEVILAYLPPGGDQIRVQIPASTRIAIKALSANATTGVNILNLWK
jgi:hypothetical protein